MSPGWIIKLYLSICIFYGIRFNLVKFLEHGWRMEILDLSALLYDHSPEDIPFHYDLQINFASPWWLLAMRRSLELGSQF